MVTVKDLYKRFGRLQVLNGIELELEPGKVHVVMGPNASGKTTLIKSILGLVIPDRGTTTVMGQNVRKGYQYRKDIGYMPQIAHFPENLSPKELIGMISDIRGGKTRKDEMVEWLGLQPFMTKKLRYLSGGTRQKVNAAMAMMYDCPVLIFDEPTVGLDPVARLKLKDRNRQERDQGKTIILTTHVMSEIEELADRIVFLLDGIIHLAGSPDEIKQSQGKDTLERAIANILEQEKI
jgi:Cu-processing system ATP-binding protein